MIRIIQIVLKYHVILIKKTLLILLLKKKVNIFMSLLKHPLIFTAKEIASNHCQLGNIGLAIDVMLHWINESSDSSAVRNILS